METKTHLLLGQYLLKQLPVLHFDLYRKAFIFGCIEPDINVFSYLQGFFTCKKFKGHHYNNSKEYIRRTLKKLQGKPCWHFSDCYRLGKLIHYLSDAFTSPHNECFTGTLSQHSAYEAQLHLHFSAYLKKHGKKDPKLRIGDAGAYITLVHKKYANMPGNCQNDAAFIVHVTCSVMRALAHSLAPAFQKNIRSFPSSSLQANVLATEKYAPLLR